MDPREDLPQDHSEAPAPIPRRLPLPTALRLLARKYVAHSVAVQELADALDNHPLPHRLRSVLAKLPPEVIAMLSSD
jgi:hypothetical protein